MILVSTLYDEHINWPKLTEQKRKKNLPHKLVETVIILWERRFNQNQGIYYYASTPSSVNILVHIAYEQD